MGWASGSEIAVNIWDAVKQHLPEDEKSKVAIGIIRALEKNDWDTQDEARELMDCAFLDDAFLLKEAEWQIGDVENYEEFKAEMLEAMDDSLLVDEINDERMNRLWEMYNEAK